MYHVLHKPRFCVRTSSLRRRSRVDEFCWIHHHHKNHRTDLIQGSRHSQRYILEREVLPSKMLHQIIESNNNGIRCLEAGRYDPAKDFFKLALEQITQILHLFKDHANQTSQGLAPVTPPSIIHVPISESLVGEMISVKSSYIYRYALTLEIDREGRPGVDQSTAGAWCNDHSSNTSRINVRTFWGS